MQRYLSWCPLEMVLSIIHELLQPQSQCVDMTLHCVLMPVLPPVVESGSSVPHPAEWAGLCLCPSGPGVRYSEFAVCHPKPPPLVGQHTVEILKSMLGYEDDAIAELLRTGVVAQHEVR
ncbi:hypothetical protein WISP_05589 [Willisornis vidua]|uniref:AMACR racemase n=1 Tax=Willisornis vidua TaxID=1566151 RepID=A0ABQ9DT71_9PASS|nr:hypothetical protein WISP_05589 [Willisornis vidua]